MTENSYENIRFLVMHEIGHCIGIGLHDDNEDGEVYSSSGFMRSYNPENAIVTNEYLTDDWNDTFAPDGVFGNSTWSDARIWNKYSIVGEIYDNTSDIMGRVTGGVNIPEWGISIILTEVEGTNYYSTAILPNDGNFSFQVKPGNYVLELQDKYEFDMPEFVNVSERETLILGNLTLEYQQTQLTSNPIVILSLITILIVPIFLLLITLKKKRKIYKKE